MLVGSFYVFVLLGAAAAFTSLLSEGTTYGVGYGVWFGGVVAAALCIAVGSIVGARAGGLEWDLETAKEIHLSEQRLFSFQLKRLGRAVGTCLGLVSAALVAALVVGGLAAMGGAPWSGDGSTVSGGMVVHLFLALVVGLPFTLLAGWAVAVILRSSYKAVLLVEGTLLVSVLTCRFVPSAGPLALVYGNSPWGVLMSMMVGDYEHPRIALEPAMSLAWLSAWGASTWRDIGGAS
jgi:hypothetical protein